MKRHPRGQALTETIVLLSMLIGWTALVTHLWPKTLTSLQVYIDGWGYALSLPVP